MGSDRVERERLGSPYEANSSDLDGGRASRSCPDSDLELERRGLGRIDGGGRK